MSRFIAMSIFLLTLTQSAAQIHEVGVFLGGSNYIGDVGPTSYIAPNELAAGIVYKWNRSPRHAYRASIVHSKISSRDIDADTPGRNLRGYEFDNAVTELSVGLEFNFFNFDLHQLETQFTPYVYTGFSAFVYDEQYVIDGETKTDYREHSFAIPMTLGIKANITPSLVLGLEAGARYTFTDNLDASNPKNDNLEPLRFGNINSKDWYVFTGFTLTYTFGEKPCFCAD